MDINLKDNSLDGAKFIRIGASFGLSLSIRKEQQALWDSVLDACSYIPFVYTNASINFQRALQLHHGGAWNDLSVVIRQDNESIGVWPLSGSVKNSIFHLSSHGLSVIPPLFKDSIPSKLRKRISKACLDLAQACSNLQPGATWVSAEPFNESIGASQWQIEALNRRERFSIIYDLYVDLQPDILEIKKGFRKSYKSLINCGSLLWDVGVLDTVDTAIWLEFQKLHHTVSERVTRSDDTWQHHLSDLDTKQGVLIYLRNKDGEMIGAGFFNFTKTEAIYSVGVYDRSLFDKPLGHVVQYKAIEEFKKRGIRWYKLGEYPNLDDIPKPTDKEISIGVFKRGFASHVIPRLVIEHHGGENSSNLKRKVEF